MFVKRVRVSFWSILWHLPQIIVQNRHPETIQVEHCQTHTFTKFIFYFLLMYLFNDFICQTGPPVILWGTPNIGSQLLPLTTAIIGYAIACWCSKGSMFVKDNSFITIHIAYAVTNKSKIVWTKTELILFYPGQRRLMQHVNVCFHSLICTQTFGGRWKHQWTAGQR